MRETQTRRRNALNDEAQMSREKHGVSLLDTGSEEFRSEPMEELQLKRVTGAKIKPKRDMTSLNAVFFFMSCGEVAFWSFVVVFFTDIGFNKKRIGLLFSVREIAGLFGALIWGPLADYFGPSVVMFLAMVAAMILSTLLVFDFIQANFHVFTFIFALASFCVASHALLDAIIVKVLMKDPTASGNIDHNIDEEHDTDSYGSTRWYYSFGYGLCSIVLALSVKFAGSALVFLCFDGFTIIGLAILYVCFIRDENTKRAGFIPLPEQSDSHSATDESPSPLMRSVATVPVTTGASMTRTEKLKATAMRFWTFEAGVYTANIFVYGCLKSFLDNFVFLTILDSMNGSLLLCGFVNAVMVVSGEIPTFYNSEYLLQRCGITNLCILALLSFVMCSFGYCIVLLICRDSGGHWQWLVLLSEPFHGASFALLWTAIIAFCARTGTRQVQATAQSAARFILSRVAGTIGALFGTALVGKYGFLTLWSVAMIIGSIWTAVFFVISRFIKKEDGYGDIELKTESDLGTAVY